jgi:MipA family protein
MTETSVKYLIGNDNWMGVFMTQFYALVCMGFFGLSPMLFAQSLYKGGDNWHGIVGVGVLFRAEAYEAIDHRMLFLPHMIMRRGNFFIEGLEAGYRVAEGEQGHFDLILTPRLEGFEGDEHVFFKDMADRDFSVDGGIGTTWREGEFEFKLSAVTDLLNKSEGEEVTLSVGNTYILTGKMTILTPSLGVRWQSKDLVNYYYGVKTTEVKARRSAYTGHATLNYIAAINATYSLSKRSTLFATVEYEHLGDGIHDSPLVNQEQIISVFLAYGWQF